MVDALHLIGRGAAKERREMDHRISSIDGRR
jgi:hypothetical protein